MATYYWVGGSGTWDASSTTNWSLTSGGSGGAGVPTSADDVRFNTLSGTASDTVSVVSGAVAKSIISTGYIDFSGVGQQLLLYGALRIQTPPPSGLLNIDDVVIRAPAGSTTVIVVAPMKNLYVINWASPAAQATILLSYDLTCTLFYSNAVSVALSASSYNINCSSCRFEGGTQALLKTVGEAGKTLNINVTPTGSTAFYCDWSYATDEFIGVSVYVSAGYSGTYVANALQASYLTSFNLTLDGGTVLLECSGGVDNFSLINGADATVNSGNIPVLGSFSLDATSSITGSSRYMDIRKKTGSANVSRTFAVTSGGQWLELGLRNFVAAATDTISITGVYGSPSDPVLDFRPGVASVGAGPIYPFTVLLQTGGNFSSTVFQAPDFFSISSGATLSGTFTVNAASSSLTPNGVLIPNLNILSGTTSLTSDLLVTNLAFTPTLGDGTASLTVSSGGTITVGGDLIMAGLSETDNVSFTSPSAPGFTLTKTTGRVDATYSTITNSHAGGGARFNAYTSNGNVNGGGNTGWKFTPGSGFFIVMRR